MLPTVRSGLPLRLMSKAVPKGALAGRDGQLSPPGYGAERRIAWRGNSVMLMQVHDTGFDVVEEPQRRSVVYEAEWKFRIGQAVRLSELSAIVLSRYRSAAGMEIYNIWIAGEAYGRPIRSAAAKALQ
ncbi:hypothetical protein ACC781_33175 [Rhizobium ruizarguesonis]